MANCLVCKTPIEPFMSFGRMPIANGFLSPDGFGREFFFELRVGSAPPATWSSSPSWSIPDRMFHEHYAFFSSTSTGWREHFRGFAEDVQRSYLTAPRTRSS